METDDVAAKPEDVEEDTSAFHPAHYDAHANVAGRLGGSLAASSTLRPNNEKKIRLRCEILECRRQPRIPVGLLDLLGWTQFACHLALAFFNSSLESSSSTCTGVFTRERRDMVWSVAAFPTRSSPIRDEYGLVINL